MAPRDDTHDNIEHRFPCDSCGSDLRFDPASGDLTCDHCGARTEIAAKDATPIVELDFTAALKDTLSEAEHTQTRISTCPNCAAKVEFDPKLHASECPFCATPIVVGTGTTRLIKPKAVLPFSLEQSQARDAMTAWLGRLWFAPSGLQQYARKGRALSGIYVPYWTFDADTKTTYAGQRGTIYYETKTIMRDGNRETRRVAKTRWQAVSGRVARWFDDVLVLASHSLPERDTKALSPWDLTDLTPYDPQYLAGLRAEGYTVSLSDGFAKARQQMDRMIARDIRFDIGGDKQRITSAETDMRDVTFKHILLPVWLAAYRYRGKSYRLVINGQTGAVSGERPFSVIKITIAVICALIVAAAIGAFVATNQ
ncbi:MAG: TFIIB-type zinc finger domain-containing protein [Paracoccaceae bacterium]